MKTTTLRAVAALALLAGGCGGTRLYQPSRALVLEAVDDREIDDEAVARAFEARPQLELPARVAFYCLDDGHAEAIEAMLESLPGVESVHRLPPLLVTGRRRLDGDAPAAGPVTIRQLRLVAARARADLLLVFDHGYRIDRSPNGLAALNVLLLPALVTPFVDARVRSYLDVLVVDTRNGYLYGNTSGDEEGRRRWLTVWSRCDEELAEAHFEALLEGTRDRLDELLGNAAGPTEPEEGAAPAVADAEPDEASTTGSRGDASLPPLG